LVHCTTSSSSLVQTHHVPQPYGSTIRARDADVEPQGYVFLLEDSTPLTIYLYCIQNGSHHLHYHHNTDRQEKRYATTMIDTPYSTTNLLTAQRQYRDDDEPQLVTSPTGHKGRTSPLSLNCAPDCAMTPTSTCQLPLWYCHLKTAM
jgi:hypothetical protein